MWCREHAEGSLLWDVFYVPDMGAQPAAQMCMERAAQQSSFSLQLASQLDQEDRLTIKTLTFLFRCSFIPCFTHLAALVHPCTMPYAAGCNSIDRIAMQCSLTRSC